jgi:hypothetical protein
MNSPWATLGGTIELENDAARPPLNTPDPLLMHNPIKDVFVQPLNGEMFNTENPLDDADWEFISATDFSPSLNLDDTSIDSSDLSKWLPSETESPNSIQTNSDQSSNDSPPPKVCLQR